MKYLQNGGFRNQPLMRLTLAGTLMFSIGLWITSGAMYFKRMSLRPGSVRAYYLGSAADYSEPRSYAAMLDASHAHLATMGVVLLLLTHLLIFTPGKTTAKKWVIGLVFGSSLLGEASGWLVRFVSASLAPLKIACFLIFQAVLGVVITKVVRFLFMAARGKEELRELPPAAGAVSDGAQHGSNGLSAVDQTPSARM